MSAICSMRLLKGEVRCLLVGCIILLCCSACELDVPSGIVYSPTVGQSGTYRGFQAGYCTYYAAREFDKLAGEPKGSGWRWRGDAGIWLKNAAKAGYETTTDPRKGQKGAIAVWSGGGFGHVAVVTSITPTSLSVSEMNWGKNVDAKTGKTDNFGKVTTATLQFSDLTRGNKVKYAFEGLILPRSSAVATTSSTRAKMSAAERKRWDSLLTRFALAEVAPFEKGRITDLQLARFVVTNSKSEPAQGRAETVWFFPRAKADEITSKYFGTTLSARQAHLDLHAELTPSGIEVRQGPSPFPLDIVYQNFAHVQRITRLGDAMFDVWWVEYGDDDPDDPEQGNWDKNADATEWTIAWLDTMRRGSQGPMPPSVARLCHGVMNASWQLQSLAVLNDREFRSAASWAPDRFAFRVLGTGGKKYLLTVRADDEKLEIQGGDGYDGAMPGDEIASGRYVAFLKQEGQSTPIRQEARLFETRPNGEFNLSRNYVNVISAGKVGQPDVLFVEEWGGSNGNYVRLFYVDKGVLRPIDFVVTGKKPYRTEYSWPLKRKGPLEFSTAGYFNGNGITVRIRWRFEPETGRFICIKKEMLKGIVRDY